MKNRRGFTLIEVSLFLALSGFLMMGLIAGSNISISRQRYNDAVNSFSEFLRTVYSDVLNVSNDKIPSSDGVNGEDAGRTQTAVYGKFVVIGDSDNTPAGTVYVYDVIGGIKRTADIEHTSILDILREDVHANIAPEGSSEPYRKTTFTIPWEAEIQETSASGEKLKALILIVRSPLSGTIHTYSLDSNSGTITNLLGYEDALEGSMARSKFSDLLNQVAGTESREVHMCIDSADRHSLARRDVKILPFASNSSAVKLSEQDNTEDNKCE